MSGPRDTCRTGAEGFQATHWSIVFTAAQPNSPAAQEAVARLYEIYQRPVYSFFRYQGCDVEQAKDLTQELFSKLIEKHSFQAVDPSRGRFRSFLMGCAKNLLSHKVKRAKALKHGGGYDFVPLDTTVVEAGNSAGAVNELSPDKVFDQSWALTTLEDAQARLKHYYEEHGRIQQFNVLLPFLTGDTGASDSYAEAGARLQLSANAARQSALRMRVKFGEIVRELVAQTVPPGELEAELRYLKEVLSG